ncbi:MULTISPECIES: Hsp70 family protein [unclassified Rhodococcus (in: high G+C Gram-positive bacteria)]|uniref:Hsp70 family protein n=1 Tax=unclassified Rhodococcus (in: high G+C Gram-positive bacteria) TaxID=192944 RepID=UPI001FF956BA|nr:MULTISPECIES: Hsp70 family protein [unclassified Rhodococcus (in: high G+C Gram-positive bacteria)]
MSAGLGIRIGTAASVAALDTSEDPHAPRDFATDEAMLTVTRRSALDLRPGAAPSLAGRQNRQSRHLISGFADRVGDPVPVIDEDGRSHQAEDLFATATRALVAEACAGTPCDPTVVVTHPDRWSTYTTDVLRGALERAGVPDATLVPDSAAAMRWLEGSRGAASDGLVVIYDLGASSLDITLMRTGAESGTIGAGANSTDFGGAQFDHLITEHVLDTAASSASFEFDPFDPDTVGALVELRARCSEAKEELSSETATTLTIDLPSVHTETRLVRGELEDLIRRPVLDSIELIRDVLHTSGLDVSDVTQVLLIGGSSSIPLVAELVSSHLRVPVVTSPHPDRIPAIGAALLANEMARAAVLDAPVAAAVALTRPAPRPAFASPAATSATESTGASGRRKVGIVFAGVAALVVIAGGGLSVGTALTTEDAPVDSVSENSTGASTSAVTAATVAEMGTAANGLPAPTVAADGSLIPAPGTAIAADGSVVSVPGSAVPAAAVGAPGAPAPVPGVFAPNVPAPNVPAPNPQLPGYTPPAYTPPAYTGPGLSDAGDAAGNVLQGVGQGVGGVVQGTGDAVGGIVGLVPPLLGNK